MNSVLKSLIKKTFIYAVYRKLSDYRSQYQEIRTWAKKGKPSPPPHIVKQRAIKIYSRRFKIRILVETGTYYGDMVAAMKSQFDRVYSIEIDENLFNLAAARFIDDNNVFLRLGDSGVELGDLVPKLDRPSLYWLDGHYSGGVTGKGDNDTPIFKELDHILHSRLAGNVIIIDDARLFGSDPAYPKIDDLTKYIHAIRPNLRIRIENDSIRITPKKAFFQ